VQCRKYGKIKIGVSLIITFILSLYFSVYYIYLHKLHGFFPCFFLSSSDMAQIKLWSTLFNGSSDRPGQGRKVVNGTCNLADYYCTAQATYLPISRNCGSESDTFRSSQRTFCVSKRKRQGMIHLYRKKD
jgi:hypothetical protein